MRVLCRTNKKTHAESPLPSWLKSSWASDPRAGLSHGGQSASGSKNLGVCGSFCLCALHMWKVTASLRSQKDRTCKVCTAICWTPVLQSWVREGVFLIATCRKEMCSKLSAWVSHSAGRIAREKRQSCVTQSTSQERKRSPNREKSVLSSISLPKQRAEGCECHKQKLFERNSYEQPCFRSREAAIALQLRDDTCFGQRDEVGTIRSRWALYRVETIRVPTSGSRPWLHPNSSHGVTMKFRSRWGTA